MRDRLREYYEGDGRDDPIRISLPKGTYTPHIEFRQAPTLDPRPARAAPIKQLMLAAAVLLIITASLWGLSSLELRPVAPRQVVRCCLALRQYRDRSQMGSPSRWDDRGHHYRSLPLQRLIVIARNSTELYKGKPIDIRQIGRDLNVKYVVEGSIQSMGDQIRVTAQLIEAASGSQVWSERYDRPVDDLFAVQNEVTQRIAATLGGYARGGRRGRASSSKAQAAREPICLRHLLAGH